MLEEAHPRDVAVLAIDEEFVAQGAFGLKADFLVHVPGARVFHINDEVDFVEIQHAEAVFQRQFGGAGGDAFALMVGRDDDLVFGAAVDMVDFDKFDQAGDVVAFAAFVRAVFDDEAAFALVADVFVVEVRQFVEGFIGFFKPVAHHVGVVARRCTK